MRPPRRCPMSRSGPNWPTWCDAADVVVNGVVGFAGLPVTIETPSGRASGWRWPTRSRSSPPGRWCSRFAPTPGRRAGPGRQRALCGAPVPASVRREGRRRSRGRPDRAHGERRPVPRPTRCRSRTRHRRARRSPTRRGRWVRRSPSTRRTLMNKGLEVIEAHELFGVGYDDDRASSCTRSRSCTRWRASPTAPRSPSSRCPTCGCRSATPSRWPDRFDGRRTARIDWTKLARLDFEPPDHEAFPCLGLAFDAGRAGGTRPGMVHRSQRGRGRGISCGPDTLDRHRRRSTPRHSTGGPARWQTASKPFSTRIATAHRRGHEPRRGPRACAITAVLEAPEPGRSIHQRGMAGGSVVEKATTSVAEMAPYVTAYSLVDALLGLFGLFAVLVACRSWSWSGRAGHDLLPRARPLRDRPLDRHEGHRVHHRLRPPHLLLPSRRRRVRPQGAFRPGPTCRSSGWPTSTKSPPRTSRRRTAEGVPGPYARHRRRVDDALHHGDCCCSRSPSSSSARSSSATVPRSRRRTHRPGRSGGAPQGDVSSRSTAKRSRTRPTSAASSRPTGPDDDPLVRGASRRQPS